MLAALAADIELQHVTLAVVHQLAAQRLRPESFVMVAGFGEGAPGYVPTDRCWQDGYDDDYCWVTQMTEATIMRAVAVALAPRGSRSSEPDTRPAFHKRQ